MLRALGVVPLGLLRINQFALLAAFQLREPPQPGPVVKLIVFDGGAAPP
jgi:hypothetical protein